MMFFWLILLVVIVWAVWAFLQRPGSFRGPRDGDGGAEAILRERYARGEIDSETYHRMKDDLKGRGT